MSIGGTVRIVKLTRQAAVFAAAGGLAALGLSGPAASAAASKPGPQWAHPRIHAPAVPAHTLTRPQLPIGEHYVCPAPTRAGQMTCQSIIHTAAMLGVNPAAPSVNVGYGPSDLRSAYKLTTASRTGGRGRLVAIVDAFNNPNAARDL